MAGAATTGRRTCSAASHQAAATSTPRPRSRYETSRRSTAARSPCCCAGPRRTGPRSNKWTRAYLLEHFGDRGANVGTGSDIIYAGGGAANHATLRDLLRRMRNGSDAVAFDARLLGTLPELARDFAAPPVLARAFPAAASYGLLSLGPSRSGLPPHAHGEAWLGLVAGRKRWFLRAPAQRRGGRPPLCGNQNVTRARRGLHAIDATPARWRGDAVPLPSTGQNGRVIAEK